MTSKNHQNSEDIHVELSKLWPPHLLAVEGDVFTPQDACFNDVYHPNLSWKLTVPEISDAALKGQIHWITQKFHQQWLSFIKKRIVPKMFSHQLQILKLSICIIYCLFFSSNRFRLAHTTTTFVSISASSNWGIPDMFLTMDSSFASGYAWLPLGRRQQQPTVAAKMPPLHRTLQGKGHKAPRPQWIFWRHISLCGWFILHRSMGMMMGGDDDDDDDDDDHDHHYYYHTYDSDDWWRWWRWWCWSWWACAVGWSQAMHDAVNDIQSDAPIQDPDQSHNHGLHDNLKRLPWRRNDEMMMLSLKAGQPTRAQWWRSVTIWWESSLPS